MILKLIIFLLIFVGLFLLVYDKMKINTAFVPIVTMSIVMCCIYVAGLLNILNLSTLLLAFLGVASFFVYMLKILKKQFCIKPFFCPGIIIFAVLSVYFFIMLRGVNLLHYDNFSHWGSIVKEMFYYNSFPDERSIIIFRNYPPGSASFIYFICKVLGYTESHALMAQSLLIASSVAALFCKVKLKDISYFVSLFIISICSVCILSYDDSTLHIYNLLVDALLGFMVAVSIVISYYYKDNLKKLFYTNIFPLTALTLIKDSGKIFLFVVCIYIFILVTNHFKNIAKKQCLYTVLLALIPVFASGTLWKAYNKKAYMFTPFNSNKFAFNPVNIINIWRKKPPQYLNNIFLKMVGAVFNFNQINTKILILINLTSVLAIILLFIFKKNYSLILKTFICTNTLGVLYLFNLYILYTAIMDEVEGSAISAFDRYLSTFVIILFLLQSLAVIHTSCRTIGNKYFIKPFILVTLIVLSVISVKPNLVKIIVKPDNRNFRRYDIQKTCEKEKSHLIRDKKWAVYVGKSDPSSGYYYYLSTYELLSKECSIINSDNMNSIKAFKNIENSEYLMLTTDNESFWKNISINDINVDDIDGSLYSISKSDGKLCFTRVDKD